VLVGEKREIGAQRMSERRQVLRPSLQRSRARNSVNALPAPSAQRASDDHPSIDALPLTTRGAIRRWGTWPKLCVGVDMQHSAKAIYRPGNRASTWNACTRSECDWYSTGGDPSERAERAKSGPSGARCTKLAWIDEICFAGALADWCRL